MRSRNEKNRKSGKAFEQFLAKEAKRVDVLAIKNGQEVRYIPGSGRMVAVKSQLDWTLVYRDGKVVCADTKSYEKNYFTYAQLSESQRKLSVSFEQRGVLAGFIVLFRACGHVSFFCGQHIEHKGPRTRFTCSSGFGLGQADEINLQLLAHASPVTI